MPLPLAIPLAIGGATALANIFSGRSRARAARRAADIHAFAETDAAREARLAANEVNPYISEAYERAKTTTSGVYNRAAEDVESRAREANLLFDPYTGIGEQAVTSLAEFAGPGKTFTPADLQFDPGYQFRLQEGMKALERSAAARGGALGGGVLRGITRYGQEAASQEYANAFDRFMRGQQQRFSNLSSLANLGYGAAGQRSQNLIGAGNTATGFRTRGVDLESGYGTESARLQAGNVLEAERQRREHMLNAANARAAGVVGSANAWGQGISNAITQGLGAGMTMYDLMNPALGLGDKGYVSASSNPNPFPGQRRLG